MNSLILQTATRFLVSLLLLASLFLLWRGHNQPGGGFAGGLMAATAFILTAIAYGPAQARRAVRIEPRLLIAVGLATALASGLVALVAGEPLLEGQWTTLTFAANDLKIGTPLLFDVGVYLAVVGVALTIILELMEEG